MPKVDGLGDRGMSPQHFVDVARRDFFSAAVDQFLDASGDVDVSVGVFQSLIAGAEPSVRKGRGVGVRVVFVPVKHVGTLDHDLAALPARQVLARANP